MLTVSNLGHILPIFQALLFIQASAYPTNAPIVDLGYAQYQGAVDMTTNTTSFLGIRYAAAPVGNLRWAAPQPPPHISGVQHATTQPNECYQVETGGTSPTSPFKNNTVLSKRSVSQSEDCLFLSVYTPGNNVAPVKSGGLPVIIWIHGGGYIGGAESQFAGADFLVESDNGLILVMIQYRLGLFGFLAGEAVKSGGALNAGLLDQNYAFQWVQSHIAKFGGDSSKVAIWGFSAGAGSVIQHVVAHDGNTQPPLFRAAITSSTFLPSQYHYNDRIPELIYDEVVAGTDCACSSDTLSCLREADVNTLENMNFNIVLKGFFGTFTFGPVVDETFVTERPSVALAAGRVNGVRNFFIDRGANEGIEFVNQSMTLNISQYISELFPNIEASQAAAAVPLYEGLGTNVDQADYAMGESIFVCPTYYLLEAFGSRAWKGEFSIPPAEHGMDGFYYWTNATSEFITAFSNAFMATAMFLNPSHSYNASDILPKQWNAWSDCNTEMMFNVTSSGAPNLYTFQTDRALLDRCAYWRSVAANTAQ